MNMEIAQMILSYPANYSDKEVAKVMWAEAGQIVSEDAVHKVRQDAKDEARTELVNLLTVADRLWNRRNDPRLDSIKPLGDLTKEEYDANWKQQLTEFRNRKK
jgi:hypothetical protein